MEMLKSKKARAASVGILVALLQAYIPALSGLPVEEILTLIIGYVVAQGVADLGKEKAKVEKNADS